ncbi:hypothetical protein SKAU_G00267210 [Synaphobranchus kaupii]|uniref:Uncharacterized protein n=1 Tax=Synaphobranchus kaupii TaxID=118154 RepID=A0A9Q1EZK0_SYNKA|nr:hypothetical protein SKAU_G00267210 [Synaphobranchus kaupii]
MDDMHGSILSMQEGLLLAAGLESVAENNRHPGEGAPSHRYHSNPSHATLGTCDHQPFGCERLRGEKQPTRQTNPVLVILTIDF